MSHSRIELVSASQSNTHDLVKYLFRFSDGVQVEAVDYTPSTRAYRWDICISTQSGCAVGCTFCGTGSRFARSLSSEEILLQIDFIIASRPEYVPSKVQEFRVLFMSMGEPALNTWQVLQSIRGVSAEYSNARQVVSTVGIRNSFLEKFVELSTVVPNLGLQFSIHSPVPEERDAIIPYPNKLPLDEISIWAARFKAASGRLARANFIVFDDWANQTVRDRRIGALLSSLPSGVLHINLSPLYDVMDSRSEGSNSILIDSITAELSSRGYTVTRSFAAGLDVGGSCGQLWQVQYMLNKHGKIFNWETESRAKDQLGGGEFRIG